MSWTVTADEENLRLDRVVPTHVTEASRAQAKRWIEEGRVSVEGRPARPSHLVRAGERVVVRLIPRPPTEDTPEPIPLDIVYEDTDLIVINKPASLVVHPGPGHPCGTLVNALLHHRPSLRGVGATGRPGIVHRLDRGTSGLLIVAKNDPAHRALSRQFARRLVEKEYLVLVHGVTPERMEIDKPIGRDTRDRKRISSRSRRTRPAITRTERLEVLPLTSLLRVSIRTGRTHQIRVHLTEAGFPVVGDVQYGRRIRASARDQRALRVLETLRRPALHAQFLAFSHPTTGATMRLEAPVPSDLRLVLVTLRELR